MNPCPKNNSLFFYYYSCLLKFPFKTVKQQTVEKSSFIIHLYTQSFVYKVSHISRYRFCKCECLQVCNCLRQRMLNYLQRLYLILPFNALHTNSFTSCMFPVETGTSPNKCKYSVYTRYFSI